MEKWIPMSEFDYKYAISNTGKIKNISNNKEIIGDTNSAGYRRIRIMINRKAKRYFVHRLVAKYFCFGYEEGHVVNHIDGDKQNNNWTNLEWCTRSENDIHAFNNNLRSANGNKKVAKFDLDTLVILEVYNSIAEASYKNDTDASGISLVVNGKYAQWKGYGYKFI